MLVIGLTGSIGSGKTAVSHSLADLGAVIIDADLIARDVVSSGSRGLEMIVEYFGDGVLDDSGSLNRPLLADRVFRSPSDLMVLNSIVHPLVKETIEAELVALEAGAPGVKVVVVVPLLAESDYWRGRFHKIVVVDTPDELVIDRLVSLRGMTHEDARARLNTQATRPERRAIADFVIDNSGTEAELRERVQEIWTCLTAESA